MHEILSIAGPGSVILDLGSAKGSFAASSTAAKVVRVDLEPRAGPPDGSMRVAADARRLPFPAQRFDAVIANHSLEHVEGLDEALAEIRRVVKPGATLYVAVPDSTTLTDKIYRWLARGGGHVNPFPRADPLIQRIETRTGMPYCGGRVLHSGFSFLNRANTPARTPWKLLLFANGHEGFLRWLSLALRTLDRIMGWRLSVYGWALYFGPVTSVDPEGWPNVCVRCGSGHAIDDQQTIAVFPKRWNCPGCGASNFFTATRAQKFHPDRDFRSHRREYTWRLQFHEVLAK